MEQKKFRVTFAKVTALLCALTILFGVIAFFGNNAAKQIEALNEMIADRNESVSQQESNIAQWQADIATYEQEKQTLEETLKLDNAALEEAEKAEADAQAAVDAAKASQSAICSRYYHSSYYCSPECVALQPTISAAQTKLTEANYTVNACLSAATKTSNSIQEVEGNIAAAEENITDATARISQLKGQIAELKGELAGVWAVMILNIVAMLLAVASLALFAKGFYEETVDKFTLYAVAGMAASSLLFFISSAIDNVVLQAAPLLFILINPYVWNMAIMGLLAAVLLNKAKNPVIMRNVAVVFSVIMGVLLLMVNPILAVLYAATVICIAFVIVPLVFTKYIDIAKHIFLSLITFGIWLLVWIYHVTKNLNEVEGIDQRKPARELLLFLFLPFYYPYWLYKTAEGVEDYGKENGKEFKIDVLCIAFAFVCPLFATVLIQNKINVVAGKPVPVVEEAVPEAVEAEETEEAEAAVAE